MKTAYKYYVVSKIEGERCNEWVFTSMSAAIEFIETAIEVDRDYLKNGGPCKYSYEIRIEM